MLINNLKKHFEKYNHLFNDPTVTVVLPEIEILEPDWNDPDY